MSDLDNKENIKKYFGTGEIPTASEFIELIELATSATALDKGTIENRLLPNHIAVTSLSGDGDALSNLDADKIATGTLDNDRLPADISVATLTADGDGVSNLDASKIASGTLNNARLPADISVTSLSGDGDGVHNLDASKVASGTLGNARLPMQMNLAALGDESLLNVKTLNCSTAIISGSARFTQGQTIQQFSADGSLASASNLQVPTEYAVKTYVDNQLAMLEAGLKFKEDVQCVATSPVNISGSGSLPNIDGYGVAAGDRVLLTDQANKAENRIYMARTGQPWTPATDFDGTPDSELFVGVAVMVQSGSQANSVWSVSGLNGSGTDAALTWRKRNDLNDYVGANGVKVSGLTISSDLVWLQGNLNLSYMTQGTLPVGRVPHTNTVSGVSQNHVTTEKAVNDFVNTQLPAGVIVMWSGNHSNIPAGWVLCDGNNSTPNLVNRFVMGTHNAAHDVGGESRTGSAGGGTYGLSGSVSVHNHRLTLSQIPSHTHSYYDLYYREGDGVDSHATPNGDEIGAVKSAGRSTGSSGSDGYHNHGATLNMNNLSISHHTHAFTPPYYRLCYIMKL